MSVFPPVFDVPHPSIFQFILTMLPRVEASAMLSSAKFLDIMVVPVEQAYGRVKVAFGHKGYPAVLNLALSW